MHVCCKRRDKMVGNLMGQVQSKVSQILNKSKEVWKAFCLLKALSSRLTDQAQVEAEDFKVWSQGEKLENVAVSAVATFPGHSI